MLAVSDEVDDALLTDLRPVAGADLILACGDLPFAYLASLMARLDRPLVFVPGNHDPDVSGYRTGRRGLVTRAGLPAEVPWPAGAVNADGRIVAVGGLTVGGLGGCVRYAAGPNQYSQAQFRWRARRLVAAGRLRAARRRPPVDVLLTHAPPRGVGDGPDPAHRGIDALPGLVRRLHPRLLLHGHVHPYGRRPAAMRLGGTEVRNVVGWHLLDVTMGADRAP